MAVKRYRSADDRTRRMAGAALVLVASVPFALLASSAVDGGSVPAAVIALLPAALIAAGVRLFHHTKAAFDIDLERRRYTAIRDGRPDGSGDLDDLGPLKVFRRVRRKAVTRDGDDDRVTVRYVVTPAQHGHVQIYAMQSPGAARRKMEGLARRWGLPSQSLDGPVRAPDQVDVPLYERLRDDPEARAAVDLRPEWQVGVGPTDRGHKVVSHNRSYEPLAESVVYVVVAIVVLVTNGVGDTVSFLRNAREMPGGDVLLGILALVVLGFLWTTWRGVREMLSPAAIEVSGRGVSYRGKRMSLDSIEEITSTDAIEIVGDRKVIEIPSRFCPRAARAPVAHELQRLILESAPTRRG